MFKTHDKTYYYHQEAAMRPVHFIERYCRHVVGDLQGQKIEVTPYFKQIITDFYGTLKEADDFRRYRTGYIEIPKKNAKSTIGACLGLYHTGFDGRPYIDQYGKLRWMIEKGAEVFACAGDKDQARIIFDISREMVEMDKNLSRVFDVYKNVIVHKKTKSRFKVISADARTKHGPNVQALIFDELHVQPNGELWHTMSKGVASRKQPVIWAWTTAGYKGTFAHEKHNEAVSIQNGKIKSKFWYVKVWAAEEEKAKKEYDTEKLWEETNPGYGITVTKEFFESQMEEIARNPANLSAFMRLHLNVWTGTEKTWEILGHWDKNNALPNEEELKGKMCWMGIDLAPVDDTTAVVEVYSDDGETFDIVPHFFIPEATLMERIKDENDNWGIWADMGLVTIMPGNITDEDIILEYVKDRASTRQVMKIGCDTYNAYMLIGKLQNEGLPALAYPTTLKGMSPPMRLVEKRITAGTIRHGGNPVLAYQAGNVMVYENLNRDRMPAKGKSKKRIDGVAAMITAVGCWMADNATQEETYTAADLIAFISDAPEEKK